MEDAAIIGLYWARDERAVAASDEKYGRLCRSLSRDILDSPEDAEECVNDTWQRAWDTMPPQRPGSLRAYLVKIARNLSIDRWRARRAAEWTPCWTSWRTVSPPPPAPRRPPKPGRPPG